MGHNGGTEEDSLAAVTRALEEWRHFPKPGNSRWVASERQAGVREQLLMYAGRAGPVCRGALFSFMHPPARLSSTTARCSSHRFGPVARLVLHATPNTEPGKCPVISHHVGSLVVRRNDGWSFFSLSLVNCLKVIRGKSNRSRSAVTTRSIWYSRVLCAVSRAFLMLFRAKRVAALPVFAHGFTHNVYCLRSSMQICAGKCLNEAAVNRFVGSS